MQRVDQIEFANYDFVVAVGNRDEGFQLQQIMRAWLGIEIAVTFSGPNASHAMQATKAESTPPLKNAPRGTSLIRRMRVASHS